MGFSSEKAATMIVRSTDHGHIPTIDDGSAVESGVRSLSGGCLPDVPGMQLIDALGRVVRHPREHTAQVRLTIWGSSRARYRR